jgi:hypothetical protein
MVGNKLGASKGKEKECKTATTAGNRVVPEADLQALIYEGLFQRKEVIHWRPAIGTKGHMKDLMRLFSFNTSSSED